MNIKYVNSIHPVLYGFLRFKLLLLLFFLIPVPTLAQCPEVHKDDVEIQVNQNSKSITVRSLNGIDFQEPRILIYNLDNRGYYFDSDYREEIVQNDLTVDINRNRIIVQNITEGDFAILLEYKNCEKQVIGWGYSGVPNSGIRIQ